MAKPARHLEIIRNGEIPDNAPPYPEALMQLAQAEDVVAGLEGRIRGLEISLANLRRDKEKEARASHIWPAAVRLFVIWKRLTKSSRSKFNHQRFELLEPFLKGLEVDLHDLALNGGPPTNPLEECAAAIAGRVDDHFSTTRANGTTKHFWEFERIFADRGEFEESLSRRPRDWRARIREMDPDPPEIEPEPSGAPQAELDV